MPSFYHEATKAWQVMAMPADSLQVVTWGPCVGCLVSPGL